MRILQRKLIVKIVKNGDIQLDFAEVQQFVKFVQINMLHIFIIAIYAKQKKENVLTAF